MSGEARPDNTAIRTALWRALHGRIDPEPHVFEDEIGLAIAAPPEGWEARPDMHPQGTRLARASIIARARHLEDLVTAEAAKGVGQYVLLGAGLDSFAQRRADLASHMRVFEIDKPEASAWKRGRLDALGYGVPPWLALVPVDFEAGVCWRDALAAHGFDPARPSLVASMGVAMYLSAEANAATLRDVAALAPGTVFAMTFLLPMDQLPEHERPARIASERGAAMNGTPFVSFHTPDEILALAHAAGFVRAEYVSGDDLATLYFAARPDGLRPGLSEGMLIART